MFDSLISSLFINSVLALRWYTQTLRPKFSFSLFKLCGISTFKGVQGYIFFISRRKFFIWVFHWNFSYFMLTSCSVCWTVPGVLIFNHRLQGLLLNPVFWSLSCSRHLYFFLLVGKYTIYDEVFLILKPFLSHGLFIKSAREVTTQTACVHNLLGPQCTDFNTVCRVFFVRI